MSVKKLTADDISAVSKLIDTVLFSSESETILQ